jgi:hypothetical protein
LENKQTVNTTNLTKELQLILEILKLESDGQYICNSFFENVDWNKFLQLVLHHRVHPNVYKKLQVLSTHHLIPSFIIETLLKNYQKNIFQMLNFCAEMQVLSKIFSDNNLPLLFLKGPVLALEVYGDLSLRNCSDIDVLVPIQNLHHVEELLISLGYVKDDYILTILNDWKWRHHHITFYHSEKQIKVEVHWRLNPGPAKEPGFDELWESRRICTFSGNSLSPIFYLGGEHLFFFLVSHGARHGWSRLRWLFDIHQLLEQDMDFQKLISLFRKFHSLHLGGQSILLVSSLLSTEIKQELQFVKNARSLKLAQEAMFYISQMVNLHNDPLPNEVANYHKQHLFSLMSYQQKILFIMSFFYPYHEDSETLPLPKQLHFLYFPLRPFLWVWRKTRKQPIYLEKKQ